MTRPPAILYGTAWKEAATEELVVTALAAGFRGIDTANQRKHYHEAGVGAALARAFADGLRRDDVFLQTKFTFRDGQDHRLPYDPDAPIATQVEQSFRSSLEHLGVTAIDSLVLHGPSRRHGLGPDDHAAWRSMEALVGAGGVGCLGVSNVLADQLTALLDIATVKPVFVQNRCYADRGWDRDVREVCDAHGIVYQGFSLLTANRHVLADRGVVAIAKRLSATPAQVVFRFAHAVGMLPLTGTTDPIHMRHDLAARDLALTADDAAIVAAAGAR